MMASATGAKPVQLALLPDPRRDELLKRARSRHREALIWIFSVAVSIAISLGTIIWFFMSQPVLNDDWQTMVAMLVFCPFGTALAGFMLAHFSKEEAYALRKQAA